VACGNSKYVLDADGTEFFSIIKENSIFQIRHGREIPNVDGEDGGTANNSVPQHGETRVFGRTESLEQAFQTADAFVEKMVNGDSLLRSVLLSSVIDI
jgi:hypothetical protein